MNPVVARFAQSVMVLRWVMRPVTALLSVCVAGLLCGACRGQNPGELEKERARAAASAFRLFYERFDQQASALNVELCYVWSKRLLDCDSAVGADRGARIRAHEGHLARMEEMDKVARRRLKTGSIGAAEVTAIEYFLAEAGLWLAGAKKTPEKGD